MYRITVNTSDKNGAGTSAAVYLKAEGQYGNMGEH